MSDDAKRNEGEADSLLCTESNNSLQELTKAFWELLEAKWLLEISNMATKKIGPMEFQKKVRSRVPLFFILISAIVDSL